MNRRVSTATQTYHDHLRQLSTAAPNWLVLPGHIQQTAREWARRTDLRSLNHLGAPLILQETGFLGNRMAPSKNGQRRFHEGDEVIPGQDAKPRPNGATTRRVFG